MLLRRLTVLCFMLPLLITPAAHSQFVRAKGTEIVDASGKPLSIHGISIGNWMVLEGYFWHFGSVNTYQKDVEAVFEDLLGPTHAQNFLYQWRQNLITKADVHRIKQDGFNTIRVPLHTKYLKTDDDEGFKLIDQLVKWCREEHIYVILMLESGVGGTTGEASDDGPGYPWLLKDAGMQTYVNKAWQRIARHYKNEPIILGYDLLNEPLLWTGYLYLEDLLEPEYRRLTEAIRKVDTNTCSFCNRHVDALVNSASPSMTIASTAITATTLLRVRSFLSSTWPSARNIKCRSSSLRFTRRGRQSG